MGKAERQKIRFSKFRTRSSSNKSAQEKEKKKKKKKKKESFVRGVIQQQSISEQLACRLLRVRRFTDSSYSDSDTI